jgi:DNA recombination protein RmuC
MAQQELFIIIEVLSILLLAAVVFALFRSRSRVSVLTEQQCALEQELSMAKQQLQGAAAQVEHHKQMSESLWQKLQIQGQKLGLYAGQLEHLSELKARLNDREEQLNGSQQDLAKAQIENARLAEIVEQTGIKHQQQLILMEQNKKSLKQEFNQLAERIFEDKSKKFDDISLKGLGGLLDPLKVQLDSFRKRVDAVHGEQIQGQAGLRNELDNLRKLNQQITDEAANLTKALKGDKKLQGNFGEQHAELLLQQAGLRKDIEYQREPNFKDQDNQNRRPDFIINLPDGKHIIIDSKVSLNDYSRYFSADDEVQQQQAMMAHVGNIENHINSLSDKDYPKLKGMNAPDFVFMFMPIEPAFLMALEAKPELFNQAYERRIAIVTPTTLLPVLRTVASLWEVDKQNRSTELLAEQAGRVYDRLRVFVEKMEKLGLQLNTAQTTYDDAWRSLYSGRGNLVGQAERFRELGVRAKKPLPNSVTDHIDESFTLFAETGDSATE